MTTHKTISSFAIAVIALLAAAVPSYAQSKSNDLFAANRIVAAPGSGLNLAFNRGLLSAQPNTETVAVEATSVAGSPAVSGRTLSTTSFMERFSMTKDQPSFGQQFKVYEPASFNAKPQFRSEDYNGTPKTRNRISFVPSLGQKIPS